MQGRREVSLTGGKYKPSEPKRDGLGQTIRHYYFQEIINDLNGKLATQPTALVLDLSSIEIDAKDEDTKTSYKMTLQDELMSCLTDHLTKHASKLTEITLLGWTGDGKNNRQTQRRQLLASLGQALCWQTKEKSANHVTKLSIEGDFIESDTRPFSKALTDNYKLPVTEDFNFTIDGIPQTIDEAPLKKLSSTGKIKQDKIGGGLSSKRTDGGDKPSDNPPVPTEEEKFKRFIKDNPKFKLNLHQRSIPAVAVEESAKEPDVKASQDQIIIPVGVDVNDDLPMAASENKSPSESYFQSLLHTFDFLKSINLKQVGMAILPGIPFSILGGIAGLIPFSLIHLGIIGTILGLSVPVFGWAVLATCAGLGFLAGIGFGIYLVVQQYKKDASRQPVEPPLLRPPVVLEPQQDSVAPTVSVTVTVTVTAAPANKSAGGLTPPKSSKYRPFPTTPDASPLRSTGSFSSSPTKGGLFDHSAKKPSGNFDFGTEDGQVIIMDKPSTGAPGLGMRQDDEKI